ncbi:MAG: metallophosphoesterase family protein [Candidatus Aenigmatarchaeota archaeon]
MKVFVLSDPHGNMRLLREVLKEVEGNGYDVFLGLGDFMSKKFFSELVTNLDVEKKSFIPGNRDYGIKKLPYLKNIDSFDFDGVRFVMVGSHHFPNLKEKVLERFEDVDPGKVIVGSHEPPERARDETHGGARVGVPEFREIIDEEQPMAWLCGHIHEAEGVSTIGETKVINASASSEVLGYRLVVEDGDLKKTERLER